MFNLVCWTLIIEGEFMIDSRYDHQDKVYVEVTAKFLTDGTLVPLSFIWEDGRSFEVDKIKYITKAASLKGGGAGIRYTISVRGRETFIFLEETRWFLERRS
jgi:hypothetical protein